MSRGHVHMLGISAQEAGVALGAALDKPDWGSATCIRSAVLQDSMSVRHDVD